MRLNQTFPHLGETQGNLAKRSKWAITVDIDRNSSKNFLVNSGYQSNVHNSDKVQSHRAFPPRIREKEMSVVIYQNVVKLFFLLHFR